MKIGSLKHEVRVRGGALPAADLQPRFLGPTTERESRYERPGRKSIRVTER